MLERGVILGEFYIEKFRFEDISSIIGLLKIAFGESYTFKFWSWKYIYNPAGFSDENIWIARHKNEVIGHIALLPMECKFKEKKVKIAQPVDTVIHPYWRKMGVFKALSEKFFSNAKNRFFLFYSFPNKRIYKIFLKLGWKKTPVLDYFIKILKFSKKIKLKIPKNFQIKIVRVEKFPKEIDEFWSCVRNQYEVALERTSSFLNWRFSKNFGDYNIYLAYDNELIVGYFVIKKESRKNLKILKLMDLQVLPNQGYYFLRLLDEIITIGKYQNFDLIYLLFPRWLKLSKLLVKYQFLPISRFSPYKPRTIMWGNCLDELLKVKKWFINLSDSDLR